MPRQARIDAPGALQHIIVRGIERRKIFADDADRKAFVDRLSRVLTESGTTCYAWTLMPRESTENPHHLESLAGLEYPGIGRRGPGGRPVRLWWTGRKVRTPQGRVVGNADRG